MLDAIQNPIILFKNVINVVFCCQRGADGEMRLPAAAGNPVNCEKIPREISECSFLAGDNRNSEQFNYKVIRGHNLNFFNYSCFRKVDGSSVG